MIREIAHRYEIISLIGQGGMADVYKAYDQILNREVAIKVLRTKMAEDPMTLVRFQREASAASRLRHPNVVDIYDVGEYNGMQYIVMEYIRGRTLKQLISQRGSLDYHEAVDIMKQLTSAIVLAHENHIIHRDIKPQNVLIKDDGTAKITDFGIAVANDTVQLTCNNAVMGSAHYLAPESAQGKEPNPKIDIYSLGIVFYELLTGEVPFRGKTATEIALKHLKEKMPFARLFNPQIPQAVENIILIATAKDPAERYDSAKEMLFDLEHCLDIKNRDAQRVQLKSTTIDIINDEKGDVHVEYVKKDPEENKKSFSWMNYALVGSGIVVAIVLLLFIGSISGWLRIPGFLGFQTMPDIVNLTKADALYMLKEADFSTKSVKFKEELSDTVEDGLVISVDKKAGSVIPFDSKMTVVLSKGPGYVLDDYTDRNIEDVKAEFAEDQVQLDIELEYTADSTKTPGTIVKQKKLKEGDVVDPSGNEKIVFVISEASSIVLQGDLIGMDVNEAKSYLNNEGIAVSLKQVGTTGRNIVVDVSPQIGTTYVQEGTDSVVTLFYD